MVLNRNIARLSKIFVDTDNMLFEEAQEKLQAMTLEIVVGADATCAAAHAAILTAVSVGHRSFPGGVKITGAINQPLNSALPLACTSLGEAAVKMGAEHFEGPASRTIVVGNAENFSAMWMVGVWWSDWKAGTDEPNNCRMACSENPLVGIAAGALAISHAFDAERGIARNKHVEINLWPTVTSEEHKPNFSEIYLPGALWLIGMGNLGQAFLWALAALPYENPSKVTLVFQDGDKVSDENWATSVLAQKNNVGVLKTRVTEQWALNKGFDVYRIDRFAKATDRIDDKHPRIALCGVDKINSRKQLANLGFDCIIDAGLGRTAKDFDRYRVTIFNKKHPIDKHFDNVSDSTSPDLIPDNVPYQKLLNDIGHCGTAEVSGASVAAPYVSALVAAIAITRTIAITSNCYCPSNEVGKISSLHEIKSTPPMRLSVRGSAHAGKPKP